MDKMEYLSKLSDRLSGLPPKEREAAIKYYDDLFNDAGIMNEQAVISSLGSPQNLAHTILNDKSGISYEFNKTKKEVKAVKNKMTSKQFYIAIAVIIITFPIWGSILIGVLGAIAAVLAAVMLFLIALAAVGAVLICMSISYINKYISIALLLSGLGLASVSFSIMWIAPAMHYVVYLMKLILKNTIKLINNILKKAEEKSR